MVSLKWTFHVRERRGNASLGHDRVGLAEQRFADHAHPRALRRGLDRRAEPRASGADHEHVDVV